MTGKRFDEKELLSRFNNQDLNKTLDTYKENVNKIIDNYLQNVNNLLEKQIKKK